MNTDPRMRPAPTPFRVVIVTMDTHLDTATERKYWKPDAKILEALNQAADQLEDRLEGVFERLLHKVKVGRCLAARAKNIAMRKRG